MEEADLIRRLQSHDSEAVSEVVARYGAPLYRYLYGIVGDHHLAEDLVSETYIRMLERIGGYRYTGAPFRAWLYRIGHNLALNAVTRRRPTADSAELDLVAQPDADPALLVERASEHAELRAALTSLNEDQQQVLMLRFVARRPISEVASELGRSEGAVKQLQLRGLRALGRLLGRKEAPNG